MNSNDLGPNQWNCGSDVTNALISVLISTTLKGFQSSSRIPRHKSNCCYLAQTELMGHVMKADRLSRTTLYNLHSIVIKGELHSALVQRQYTPLSLV